MIGFLGTSIRRDWTLFSIHTFFYGSFMVTAGLFYSLSSSNVLDNKNEQILVKILLGTMALAILKMQYAWVTRYKVELGNLEALGFTRHQLIVQYSLIGIIADGLAVISCLLFLGLFDFPDDYNPLKFTGVWLVILLSFVFISFSFYSLFIIISRKDPMLLLRKEL